MRAAKEVLDLHFDERFNSQYTINKCFIKDEAYSKFKHARGIFSRVDVAKVYLGPIFKRMEEIVYGNKSFIKHVPVSDRPQYILDHISQPDAKIMATDYTAFESHFTSEMMQDLEFQCYNYLLGNHCRRSELMTYFKQVLGGTNICAFKTFVAQIEASRMSGEMNTSLGNGLSNLILFHYVHDYLGNKNARCVIEGDDCLGTFYGEWPTEEIYDKLGFRIKIERHTNIEHASFCGMIFDAEERIIVADPIKIIVNTSWFNAKYVLCTDKKAMGLLKGKALSMLCQYPGTPVVQSFAEYLIRTIDVKAIDIRTSWEKEYRPLGEAKHREVGDRTRLLMQDKFGISVGEQLELECYFNNLTRIEQLWHPVLFKHSTVDMRQAYEYYVQPLLGEAWFPVPGVRINY